ncbi:MAG: circularly permuted type 2 ATP-grasp protein [Nitrospirae bacterium]|nr:circularly permuted type 2 ATP-grasp protein [Candidatus Manganitrophaceae bacterium]
MQRKETEIPHYQPYMAGYDEMCMPDGEVRPHWAYLARVLAGLNQSELDQRRAEANRLLRENGVTYNVYGDPAGGQRPWPLDLIPFLIPSEEWRRIESGLAQRAEVLNLLLRDIYGPRDLIRRGLLPSELVYGHPGFLRPCSPLTGRKPHALILYAADLARGPDGRMWVLSDRTQAPSGTGYALENRTVLSQVFPSLYRDSHVHRLAVFFRELRASLAGYAPAGTDEPRVVILTPGPLNETYFEHAYLANYLGYNLVRGDDLMVRNGRVWIRSLKRLEQVDVIWRRVDDTYCDPLELLPDSDLGIPGLVEAVRQGHVTVVNPLGASVLENPALNAFLPGIAQYFLGQPLELPTVATWWCGRARERRHVLAHLDRMVVRTIHRRVGARPIYGPLLSSEERREVAHRIQTQPHLYVGQEQIALSCAPTLVEGKLAAHHAVLRAFLIARDDGYVVMPGGLTRVGSSGDNLIVSNQAGGIAKDTWIIASEPEKQTSLLPPATAAIVSTQPPSLPPRAADNLFWFARYAERAEQSMRLMRTVLTAYQSSTRFEEPHHPETLEALRQTLSRVTGLLPGGMPVSDSASELLAILADSQLRGGIAFNLRVMLEAAQGVRDPLSSDARQLVNDLRERLTTLERLSLDQLVEAEEHLNHLVTALAGLSGLVMESMFRGEAWLFWEIGRRLERGLSLVSLLRGSLVPARPRPVETNVLEAVLRTCDNLMAYRRLHNGAPEVLPTLALLLLDELSPRSLKFQLSRLEKHTLALPRDSDPLELSEEIRCVLEAAAAMRLLDLTLLASPDPAMGRRQALDEFLRQIERLLRATSDALSRDYFTDGRGPRQLLRAEMPT